MEKREPGSPASAAFAVAGVRVCCRNPERSPGIYFPCFVVWGSLKAAIHAALCAGSKKFPVNFPVIGKLAPKPTSVHRDLALAVSGFAHEEDQREHARKDDGEQPEDVIERHHSGLALHHAED